MRKKAGEIRDLYKLWREYGKIKKRWKEIKMDKPLMMSKTVWGVLIAALAAALHEIGQMLQTGQLDMLRLGMILLALIGTILAAIGGREAIGKCMKQ